MFNVTIIKLKDIIKIGIILILIYVFSNFILKNFRKNNLLNTSYNFDSINFIKTGIEKQSIIIKNISKEANSTSDERIDLISNNDLFDIKSILKSGSNLFLLKNNENNDGQDDIKDAEGDKENRSRCYQNRG